MAVLELLAERYGWTPETIKSIPDSEMVALLHIVNVKNILREKKA
jgi:hypothetical protein